MHEFHLHELYLHEFHLRTHLLGDIVSLEAFELRGGAPARRAATNSRLSAIRVKIYSPCVGVSWKGSAAPWR
jgi:hypothetical protein